MAGLTEMRLFLSFAGPQVAFATLRSTLRRQRLDRGLPEPTQKDISTPFETPGRLLEVSTVEGGALWLFERAGLEIVYLCADMVRISWEPGPPPVPYAIERRDWSYPIPQLTQTDGGFNLDSEALRIHIARDGALQFSTPLGKDIRTIETPRFQVGGSGLSWTDTARLRKEEHLYGLGEQAGSMNLRGVDRTFWNTDPSGSYGPGRDPIYMTLPVILGLHSNGSYLVFYENSFPGRFCAAPLTPVGNEDPQDQTQMKTDEMRVSFSGGMLRSYFIVGAPDKLLNHFTELTGRAPLPPRWSLGYHQSRWGYKSSDEIRALADNFRRHDLPLSAIHLDIDYMDGYRVFTVHPDRFSDIKELCRELEAQDIRLVTIIDPGVKCDPNFDIFNQGSADQRFCYLGAKDSETAGEEFHGVAWPGWSAFPDFTDPETRRWWAGLYSRLLDQGVAGIWHDMNEPASFAFDGKNRPPLDLQHNLDGQFGTHRQARNLYALLMNRAGYEGLRQARSERRPWIVSRSGWVSQQRYAWNWTGDIESTWEALRMTIASVIGCGLSGMPYNGPDIGGFSGHPSAELYLRWFQMASFLPFCRTHSALNVPRREPWSYGEPYTSIIRNTLKLRFRLLPYLYTLAWEAHTSGAPLVRPLFWSEPGDSRLWSIDDAFLLGDSLLIAPVLEPAATNRLLLPPAGAWYDFWDDRLYQDEMEIHLICNLEHLPILVRAGSILPLEVDHALELHLYPPLEGNVPVVSQLYLDAGDGYGDQCRIKFAVQYDGQKILIESTHFGDFKPEFQTMRLIWHGNDRCPVEWNGDLIKTGSIDPRLIFKN